MKNSNVFDCKYIRTKLLSKNNCFNHSLTNSLEIPFDVKRIYYIYNLQEYSERGFHSHKNLEQIVIAVRGSFSIMIDDGINQQDFNILSNGKALYLPPGLWRKLYNFSSNCFCLVLASEKYLESDYIRDYKQFISYKTK